MLFELDRGMEFKQAFKAHVRVRIEMITSGLYERVFAQRAVKIAYVTLGESERTRTSRRTSMCAWARRSSKSAGFLPGPRSFTLPTWRLGRCTNSRTCLRPTAGISPALKPLSPCCPRSNAGEH